METRKVILYISMSVDGFLATKDNDLSWLSIVEKEGEDYGYGAFTNQVDTYIVGRKTYDIIKGLLGGDFPQAKQYECYVITRQSLENDDGVQFYNGDISELIARLKAKSGGHIYCDGGAEIVQMLMKQNLIDEYIISVIPIMLGEGIRLFKGGIDKISLKAKPSTYFESGLVQLHYEKA